MDEVSWITAFLDLPADRFGDGVQFWSSVTGGVLSPMRGNESEFATLAPATGDPFLRVQRVQNEQPSVHVDLHTGAVEQLVQKAQRLGAQITVEAGYVVMSSPGEMAFCVVDHHGETVRPTPHSAGGFDCLIDQVCLDVPGERYEAECTFWAELTGWELKAASRPEFSVLVRPPGMPLRILLQRLGDHADELPRKRAIAHAHLDIACGSHVDQIADIHEGFGAKVVRRELHWTTMSDPAGAHYCLTSRDPITGVL
jgi:Glyoxalase-like domain